MGYASSVIVDEIQGGGGRIDNPSPFLCILKV
jgi:hypothetical protein